MPVGKRTGRPQVAIDDPSYVLGHGDSQGGLLLLDPGVLFLTEGTSMYA